MSFEKILRIPNERIGVLIGKSGNVKSKIEQLCYVTLDIEDIASTTNRSLLVSPIIETVFP